MTYAPAAPEFERLPWLNDEKKAASRPNGQMPLVLWSLVAALLIAGASYWIGMTSSLDGRMGSGDLAAGPSSATISLPAPSSARSRADQVSLPSMPQVEPVRPAAPVEVARLRTRSAAPAARPSRTAASRVGSSRSSEARAAARPSPPPAQTKSEPQGLWPAQQSEGAAGRMVRIGTFASRSQAKRGWREIVRVYPGMGRLQSVVVPSPSLRNGRTYYRLQFGTTSHAHSAVLCQWMRTVAQSCVIVGSPAGAGG